MALPTFDPPPGWIKLGNSATTSAAYSYAKSRKLSDTAIQATGMGISTTKPEDADQDFRNRLIVPILAADNETWLGYVGRSLRKSGLPYMYKRGMLRGKILYNQKELYRKTDEPLLVVEGTLDVAFLWPNAVATLGTWSEEQFHLLQGTQRPVVVVLDGDAWRKGEALAMKLKLSGVRAGHVRLPPTLDPDEVDQSWLRKEVFRAVG